MPASPEFSRLLCDGIRKLYAPTEAAAAPPMAFRVERHPFHECFFALSGTCVYWLNGEWLTVAPGTFCWIRTWIPHQYGFLPATGGWCEQLWLSVHAETIHYEFLRSRKDGSFQAVPGGGRLPGAYAALFHHLTETETPDEALSRMRFFFELLLREVAARCRAPAPEEHRRETSIVATLKTCIRNRNGVHCSLAELESLTGYSRSHLSHLFRAETGFPIGEYINQVRHEYVERAVRHGLKQKEIAAELGFSSGAAFRLWKKRRALRITSSSPGGGPFPPTREKPTESGRGGVLHAPADRRRET